MKYYIIKPRSAECDNDLLSRIAEIDTSVTLVEDINDADICVLQKGFSKSKIAVNEYLYAIEHGIKCVEQYMYDKVSVKLN